MKIIITALIASLVLFTAWTLSSSVVGEPPIDDTPAEGREWGFYPKDNEPSQRNPASFTWRPQENVSIYTLQVATDPEFQHVYYEKNDLTMNVHTPPVIFKPRESYWRFRYTDTEGNQSSWSQVRRFTIASDAVEFPLPERQELLERIPDEHPRIFVRPENMQHLRELASGELNEIYEGLIENADELIANPFSTEEPPIYPPGLDRGSDGWLSDEWRKIWIGNRRKTTEVLEGATTLGFVYQLSGDEKYGQEARRILMEVAKWNPQGATGYLYNDEAGMPYISRFSRAYTFVNDLLSEEEKQICRNMMKIRGEEMYSHLYPDHLWDPYQSHNNRAWHFLGEAAVAFKDEIPEAENWLWFAMNVFFNVYPVWSDSNGGWFEGVGYWQGYLSRFTWWADIMRKAMSINAFDLPYFSKAGYFPMYVHPPGIPGGGFGDGSVSRSSSESVQIMEILAAQSSNPHWQWFVEQHEVKKNVESSYVSFVRAASLPAIEAKAPSELPTSRLFHGVGQAMLNTTLLSAENNVQVLFKSSPMGIFSHGNDSHNGFMLYAYGERLFLSSGRYRTYGNDHHRYWMFHTKSQNNITISGKGQIRSPSSKGEITEFYTSEHIDFVSGEAGEAYGDILDRFKRSIVFIKPSLVVIVDRLSATKPEQFEYRLHSETPFQIYDQKDIYVKTGKAASSVSFHAPEGLQLSQTDYFEPPDEGVDLTQYHLTAETREPTEQVLFLTSLRPQRSTEPQLSDVSAEKVSGGYLLKADVPDGKVIVLVRDNEASKVSGGGYISTGAMATIKMNTDGKVIEKHVSDGSVHPQ